MASKAEHEKMQAKINKLDNEIKKLSGDLEARKNEIDSLEASLKKKARKTLFIISITCFY